MGKYYKIVYLGKLQPSTNTADAVKNLSTKFKLPIQRAEDLISSSKPKIIKSKVPRDKAMKYRDMLIKAGLQVKVAEMASQSRARYPGPDAKAVGSNDYVSGNSVLVETEIPIEKSAERRNLESNRVEPVNKDQQITQGQFELVSGWTRLLNSAIDYVSFILLAGIVGFVIGLVGSILRFDMSFLSGQSYHNYVLGFMVVTLYYAISEWSTGKTVGKFLTGTKVVNEEGKSPTFSQALARTLIRYVPFEFLTFFGSETRGLHDRWANTYVIKAR